MKINFEEFEVVKQVPRKRTKQVISIFCNGDFAINGELKKILKSTKFEVRIKRDCSQMLLLPNGKELTDIGKNNRVKNYAVLEKLEARKIKLPAYYVGEWDDENECWIGELVLVNPNKTNKKVVK